MRGTRQALASGACRKHRPRVQRQRPGLVCGQQECRDKPSCFGGKGEGEGCGGVDHGCVTDAAWAPGGAGQRLGVELGMSHGRKCVRR